jgi:Cd2+/Zn2+-exporting ATPase
MKATLLRDRKFRWLLASVALVTLFELLSLAGWHLPRNYAIPLFATIILAVGSRTIGKGLRALVRLDVRSINLLMVVAVLGAFYTGQHEEAAVVIVLFTLGERLEEIGIASSKSALRELVEKTPKRATIQDATATRDVPVGEVEPGQTLVIKPAEMIALDAVVTAGSSSVDESTITGEPLPRDKRPGDLLFAGTLNLQGYLEARVSKRAAETTLARIVEITFDATKAKARTQRFIERFSAIYTPAVVVGATLLVLVPTLFLHRPFEPALREALMLLVIACPCALVISTPISIYAAIGRASSRGVLVKGGKYVEAIGRIRAIAVDKTRTLTYGRLKVTDVVPVGDASREHLLACAGGIERYSEHPLARSIVEAGRAGDLALHEAENFEAVMGKGAKADCVVCYDRHHCIGKLAFVQEEHEVDEEVIARVEALQREGKTSIVISSSGGIEGIIALTDEIKPESARVVAELKDLGVETVMLTGDHRAPAEVVARQVGIGEVQAGLLPDGKAEAIRALTGRYETVAMVGDGVNDAPALALASVGIAMGAAGSDTAIEAASIAILNDRLDVLPFLVGIGRRTISTIQLNTAVAIATKLAVIALAVAGLSNLALAIFADVGVTLLVILNSLRLLRYGGDVPLDAQR